MKRLVCLALTLLSLSSGILAQKQVDIKGEVVGIPSGKIYLLVQKNVDKLDTLSSVQFKDSKFQIRTFVNEPIFAKLVIGGYGGGFDFFIEPNTKYQANLRNDDLWSIQGGALQQSWNKYSSDMGTLITAINEKNKRYEQLRKDSKFRSASKLNDTLTLLNEEYLSYQKDFLNKNDNILAAYLAQTEIESKNLNLEESSHWYARLGSLAKASTSGRLILKRIERLKSTTKGSKAPDFSMPDVNGRLQTLSQIKGKIKIVDFWASWCGPCRLSNQKLKQYYEEFADKGLSVVGVSLDDNRDKWLTAIKQQQLPWLHISDLKAFSGEVARMYNIKSIPALFILDKDNNIIARDLKGEALYNFLKEHLL